MECEDLPTLLKFDIVHMQDGMNPAFVANIEKDGVELMDKLHEKYNYLKEAVSGCVRHWMIIRNTRWILCGMVPSSALSFARNLHGKP